jgi:hypothetical protein
MALKWPFKWYLFFVETVQDRKGYTRRTIRAEETLSCHTYILVRTQRRTAGRAFIRLGQSDSFTVHEKVGSLGA